MATSPLYTQDPRTKVRSSTKLWSDVVRAAQGDEVNLKPNDPAYQFSSGRVFDTPRPEYGWTQNGTGT